MTRVGLISDTHGLLRPEAERFLQGCDHIVHAGDIGKPEVLARLQAIAPVAAVRGNNDIGPWAADLPERQTLRLNGVAIFVLHDLHELESASLPADIRAVICGHSHKPEVRQLPSGLLIINPGSAGARRFKLPVTAAELLVPRAGALSPRIVNLLEP